jgi:hypothetical protein
VRGRIIRDVQGGVGQINEPGEWIWWVQIRNAAGRIGWVRVTNQFEGTDRLALAGWWSVVSG